MTDSLTASGLIKDDARIVALRAVKLEVDGWTGVTITVAEIDGGPGPLIDSGVW